MVAYYSKFSVCKICCTKVGFAGGYHWNHIANIDIPGEGYPYCIGIFNHNFKEKHGFLPEGKLTPEKYISPKGYSYEATPIEELIINIEGAEAPDPLGFK